MTNAKKKSSWTSAQLRDTVATAKSWRDVLRALGYSPTSGAAKERLRRDVAALGLSTAHFTGQRRWSDARLIRAVAQAYSWPELLRAMNIPDDAASRAMVRSHASRLNLELGPLERQPSRPRDAFANAPFQPESLRRAAPSVAMAWYLSRGMTVLEPAEPEPFDLLVISGEQSRKVQVKTTMCLDRYGSYQAKVASRRTHGPYKDQTVPYDPADVDIFFIIAANGQMYQIPFGAVGGRGVISLNAYRSYRCGMANGLFCLEFHSTKTEPE